MSYCSFEGSLNSDTLSVTQSDPFKSSRVFLIQKGAL